MTWSRPGRRRSFRAVPHHTPPKLKQVLLATVASAAAILAAAPAAQAGWVTGHGNPPAMRADDVCRNGMKFEYATFTSGPLASQVTLHDLVVIPPRADGDLNPRLTKTIFAGGTFAIPYSPTYIDPNTIGGSIGTWRVDLEGWFDYVGGLWLAFNHQLAPGTVVQVKWRPAPTGD